MKFLRDITAIGSVLVGLLRNVSAAECNVVTAQSAIPSTPVALKDYSYCGGYLNVTVWIQNLCYNKIVELYYADGLGRETPLTVIAINWIEEVDGTNYQWEYWGAQTPVYIDGLTKLINITYQAVDIGKEYTQNLNLAVTASGDPAPPAPADPSPYASPQGFSSDITTYLDDTKTSEAGIAKAKMFNNLDVPGSKPGSVIAAQSYTAPDYAYHWVRDASLTMDVVVSLYGATTRQGTRSGYEKHLWEYAQLSADEQNDPTAITGLGEPKFNLNGSAFTGPWGRPQNDGPATRAITLMRFASAYMANGGSKADIVSKLWDSDKYPTAAPILKDLKFVVTNWTMPSFDIWEEESSDHFYNRLVSRRALLMGANFATQFGYTDYAKTFSDAAAAVGATLSEFWDVQRGLILYEYGPVLRGKSSYKDVAVVLGVLHGYASDGVYAPTNEQVLSTAYEIATSFLPVYPIASKQKDASGLPLGIPIGRYPEDVYDGVGTSRGNPWFLTTAAMAELFYDAAAAYNAAGSITVTSTSEKFWKYFAPHADFTLNRKYTSGSHTFKEAVRALQGWGDMWMRTVKYYGPKDGSLPEEFDRDTGTPTGAKDLTWSYASILTAGIARANAIGDKDWLKNLANIDLS